MSTHWKSSHNLLVVLQIQRFDPYDSSSGNFASVGTFFVFLLIICFDLHGGILVDVHVLLLAQ